MSYGSVMSEPDKVMDHYRRAAFLYRFDGANIHHGLWDENTRTLQEAEQNSNRFVAEMLQISKDDRVLDAGCGTGGASVFMAKTYGAQVVGINIVDEQIEAARAHAQQMDVEASATFLNRSFLDTGFADNSFTKMLAVESVCLTSEKTQFINEAYRVLKPGGKLLVLDGFLLRSDLTNEEQKLYARLRKGFGSLYSLLDTFVSEMRAAGFTTIKTYDKTKDVQQTAGTYHRMVAPLLPVAWLLKKLRIVDATLYHVLDACWAEQKVARHQFLIYCTVIGEK